MIGELDRRITIYYNIEGENDFGEIELTRRELISVWAKFEPGTGSEATEANKVTASLTAKFTIRYRTGLNETMSIYFDSEWYDIISINKIDRKRYLEITAEKKY